MESNSNGNKVILVLQALKNDQVLLLDAQPRCYEISSYLDFISLEILFLNDRDIKRH